jgi:hypothetical protein
MANTNDFQLCKEYLINYLHTIKTQSDQYQMELSKHFQTCPTIPKLSFDQIQRCLKEFVDRERNYLSVRNNEQLIKSKDNIHETNLLKTISTSCLINDQQVSLLHITSNRTDFCFVYQIIFCLPFRINPSND